MSINWVMLDDNKQHTFIPLPGESTIYISPPRVTFQLSSPSYVTPPVEVKSKDGKVFITNKRVIYIPSTPTPIARNPTDKFESFSAPFRSINDSHVTSPLFGPNVFVCTVRAVPNGNLPDNAEFELKLTFKEGGTFDFQNEFEAAKERVNLLVENGLDPDDAAPEDLPSYDFGGGVPGYVYHGGVSGSSIPPPPPPPPFDGPPPGYEEAQMQGVTSGLRGA